MKIIVGIVGIKQNEMKKKVEQHPPVDYNQYADLKYKLESTESILKDRIEEIEVQKVQIKCLKESLREMEGKMQVAAPAVEVVSKTKKKKSKKKSYLFTI